jgi:uncharacterized sporulation protein YeaH/YhbH (DUF444 family)
MIGRTGGEYVSIPIPRIDIPEFRYGSKNSGGVGSGPGENGQALGPGPHDGGVGQAGDAPGEHMMEVEVGLAELAELMGEKLQLPRIRPKGQSNIVEMKDKYTNVRQTGPESLRHFKRTFKQALKRQLASGLYDPDDPLIVPFREDRRYRSWTSLPTPRSAAVLVYVMDVSGSMTDDQKAIVRNEAFWIDTWMKSQYQDLEKRYVIHDSVAREVDEHTFYHTRESGGTRISSAYKLADEIIQKHYPTADWNIYVMQFSDGDNWGEDNLQCIGLLKEKILPVTNQLAYVQVHSPYGTGEFLRLLKSEFGDDERLALSEVRDREGIIESIREVLGKGR